jgi:hypothetical protein
MDKCVFSLTPQQSQSHFLCVQLSVKGPGVAGVLLTRAGSVIEDRRYAK